MYYFFVLIIISWFIIVPFPEDHVSGTDIIQVSVENDSSDSPWNVSSPEEQGIESVFLADMLKKIKEEEIKIRSVLILRNGHLVLESYIHPYNRDVAHDIKSVSKSIISALVGIALQDNILSSLDQTVFEFFPEYFSGDDKRKQEINLEHLLKMGSGLELDENGPVMGEIMSQENWIKETLTRPLIYDPGERFQYCTLLTHTMSAILSGAVDMDILEWSRIHLFNPLRILAVHWEKGPLGYYFGGDRLWLKPRDMAKFGYLYLNEGRWNGRQIVPENWVKKSIINQYDQFNDSGYNGYGYWWWLSENGSYLARGFGGQIIAIFPHLNMVVVFTGADNEQWKNLLYEFILPAIKSEHPLSPDPEEVTRMININIDLQNPTSQISQLLPEITNKISGKTYSLAKNNLEFSEITLWFEKPDVCRLSMKYNQHILELKVGLDNVYRISDNINWGMKPDNNTLALRGHWIGDNKFYIDFHEVGEPFYFDIEMTFIENEIKAIFSWKPMNWEFTLNGQWE
jgi:CubicO group peptidase (beta-lactamase class C family)